MDYEVLINQLVLLKEREISLSKLTLLLCFWPNPFETYWWWRTKLCNIHQAPIINFISLAIWLPDSNEELWPLGFAWYLPYSQPQSYHSASEFRHPSTKDLVIYNQFCIKFNLRRQRIWRQAQLDTFSKAQSSAATLVLAVGSYITSRKNLVPQTITTLLCHNYDVTKCEWWKKIIMGPCLNDKQLLTIC